MKRLFATLLLLSFTTVLWSQGDNSTSFVFSFGKQLALLDNFNTDIDTVNASNLMNAAYNNKFNSHSTYGFDLITKKGYGEFGGGLLWGITKETFASGDDPTDNS